MTRYDFSDRLMWFVMFFIVSVGVVVMFKPQSVDLMAAVITLAMLAMTFFSAKVLPRFGLADPVLVTMMNFLASLGVLFQYNTHQMTSAKFAHALFYAIGFVVMVVTTFFMRGDISLKRFRLPLFIASFAAIYLTLTSRVFEHNGVRAWIPIFGGSGTLRSFSLQPSELVKITLIVLLADVLGDHRRNVLVAVVFAIILTLGVMFQKDYGTALIYFFVSVSVLYVGTSNLNIVGGAVVLGAAALLYMNSLDKLEIVWKRVDLALNPFVSHNQLSAALTAIANGNLTGLGLSLGRSATIPLYDSDFVFASICEQFGIIFGLCLIIMFGMLVWRAMIIARSSERRANSLIAVGVATTLAVQTFFIIGGVIAMIPLTGLPLPFISSGGSSMVSSMAMIGILSGISARAKRESRLQGEVVA